MIFSKTHAGRPENMEQLFERAAASNGNKVQDDALIALGKSMVAAPDVLALKKLVPLMQKANEMGAQMEQESPKPNSNKP